MLKTHRQPWRSFLSQLRGRQISGQTRRRPQSGLTDLAAAVERLEARTLLTDLTPPVVLSATPIDDPGGATFSHVKVVFDEPVATSSATNTQNYRLIRSGSTYVSLSAAVVDSSDPTGKTILLTCVPQSTGASYGVHVGGVADLAGNASPLIGRNYGQAATLISSPRAMTLGDFDNDGIADVVTSSNNDKELWLHKGISGGSFSTPVLLVSDVEDYTRSEITSADLDGDGNLDLISPVFHYENSGIQVFWGNGDGTFSGAHHHSRGIVYKAVTADMDGDGDLDVVVSGGAGFSTYFNPRNPGSGTPASQATVRSFETWASLDTPSTLNYVVDIHVGDVNLDGRQDVVGLPRASGAVAWVWLGTNNPEFYLPPETLSDVAFDYQNALADVTGDGRLDLVSGSMGAVFVGSPLSPFFAAPSATGMRSDLRSVYAIDLDADGDLDLIGGRYPQGSTNVDPTVYISYNQGGGVFETVTAISLADLGLKRIRMLGFSDMNGDGLVEIVGIDGSSGTANFFVLKSQIGASSANFVFTPNSAPTPNAGGAYSIAEGGTLSLSAAASTDPNGDSLTYSWDINNDGIFGDATGVAPTLTWSQLVALGITDNGTRTVVVRATDPRGGSATSAATLSITNTPPTLTLSGNASIGEGAIYVLTLAASGDPGADSIASWLINWGDGTTSTVSGGPVAHIYADNGNYVITATATDEDGTYAAGNSVAVAVANVAPTVSAGGAGSSNEGSAFTRGGSFSDPGADTWTATVDYGDGTGIQALTLNPDRTFSLSHVYVDDGSYSITVTITDDDGGVVSTAFTVVVANVIPNVTLTGPANGSANQAVTFDSNLTGNPYDTYTFDWKLTRNGFTDPILAIVSTTASTFTFTPATGIYTVTLVVTDEDGSKETRSSTFSVASSADTASDIVGYSNGVWTVGTSTGSSFNAPTTWATWSNIAAPIAMGDFNGDGAVDVLRLEGSILRVGIAGSGSFVAWPLTSLGPGTYTDLTVGDVNGDGRTDVLTRLDGTWYVSLANGTGFDAKVGWATWSTAVTWADLRLVDLDGDGRSDLLGRTDYKWYAALSTGSAFGPAVLWSAWSNQAWDMTSVIDANGDGKTDLLGRLGTGWYVALSVGRSLSNPEQLSPVTTSLWAQWNAALSWTDHRVGDFDGDQKTDIIARTGGSWYVGLSNGSTIFTTSYWGGWNGTLTWQDVRVGDFTGDGKADLAGRWSGTWYVSTSAGNAFNNGAQWGPGWPSNYSFVGVGRVSPASTAAAPAASFAQSSSSTIATNSLAQTKADSLALFWSSTKDDDRFAASLLNASRA